MTFSLRLLFLLLILISVTTFGQSPGLTFGGNQNDLGYSLAITRDSGYILAGSTRSYGVGSWDGYAIKLSREGKFQWSKTYGWKHHDYFQQVYPLDNGYLFLGHVWDFGLGGRDIYLFGTSKSFGKGSFDMMMAKVNKNGIIEQLIGGVDTLLFDQAIIYPNPMKSSGQLLPPDITEEYYMKIVSLNGTIVQVSSLEAPNFRFSVETLPAGLYIYRISKSGQENYTIQGKLIVQ